MIDLELWRAKAQAIAEFAGGPGIMIEDDDERDARIASILVLIDIEYESVESIKVSQLRTTKLATITDIHGGEIHASNSKINWAELRESMRQDPEKPVRLLYDKHHTAVVTAGKINKTFDGFSAFTERRGEAGLVIVECDLPN